MSNNNLDFLTRFWRYVVKNEEGCWSWIGHKDENGYGRMSVLGKKQRGHRISYTIHFGKIPDKMFVCHRCDNPECTRPDHLFLGTNKDNMKDAYKKGRLPTIMSKVNQVWIKSPHYKKSK